MPLSTVIARYLRVAPGRMGAGLRLGQLALVALVICRTFASTLAGSQNRKIELIANIAAATRMMI